MPDPPATWVLLFADNGAPWLCPAGWKVRRAMKDTGGHSDIVLWFTLAHNSTLLSYLGDDTIKCAMRCPRFPVCGHSHSAGFSLFSSSFRSRWFLSGSHLAIYSNHFVFPFTFHFVSFFQSTGGSLMGHGSGNHADLSSFPCPWESSARRIFCIQTQLPK